jgi:hypothetical protein
MDNMLNRMVLSELQCVIMANLATKVSNLMRGLIDWKRSGVSIHSFAVREITPLL